MLVSRSARVRVVAAGAVLVPLLAACSGSSSGDASSSPAATSSATPVAIAPAALVRTSVATAKKVTSSELTLTAVTSAGTVTADAQVGYRPTRMSLTMSGLSGDSGTVKQILVGTTMYLQMPMLTKQTGKPWAKIDLSDPTLTKGLNLSSLLGQAQQVDPGQSLQLLEKSANLTLVGTESVSGVSTRHLKGTVDVASTLSQYSPELTKQLTAMLSDGQMGPVTLDVWIDGDNLPRKTVQTLSVAGSPTTVTLLVKSYNKPVTVTVPPAAQVVDLAELGKAPRARS